MVQLFASFIEFDEEFVEDMTNRETYELSIKAFAFIDKLSMIEKDKKGYWVIKDPNEEIIPIDGLVIKVGRKFVKLKSGIKYYVPKLIGEFEGEVEDYTVESVIEKLNITNLVDFLNEIE